MIQLQVHWIELQALKNKKAVENMKRFIKEYTSYVKKGIEDNKQMQPDIKKAALENIENLFTLLDRQQLISVNEYMRILSNIMEYTLERM